MTKKAEEHFYFRTKRGNKVLPKEGSYYVKGMHCASCEILIEKKLLEMKNIKSVEADASRGKVLIEYEGKRPKIEKLNSLLLYLYL